MGRVLRFSASVSAHTRGGGIYVFGGGTPKLNAATVTANQADVDGGGGGTVGGSGGGISGNVAFKNSIVAGNLSTNDGAEDCYDAFGGAHDLVGFDTGCGIPGVPDPKLKPLADNGGPTMTHALMAGSLAIGRAGNSAPPKDQRGHKRDSHPDSGAFER